MANAGVEPPFREKPSERWLKTAARKLDRPPLRHRLAAMSRHMAAWHYWRGETEPASTCAALAASVEKNFAASPLVRAMLERTAATDLYDEAAEMLGYGTPEVRQFLKSQFFQTLKKPTAKDLALLDFTEAALSCLDAALALLPGERRPRDEHHPEIAFAIAGGHLDAIISANEATLDKSIQAMLKDLRKKYSLGKREGLEISSFIVQQLIRFIDEVCSGCSVNCFKHPNADVSEIFFSPRHPVEYSQRHARREEQLELDDLWTEDPPPLKPRPPRKPTKLN